LAVHGGSRHIHFVACAKHHGEGKYRNLPTMFRVWTGLQPAAAASHHTAHYDYVR
jgi:hypothetical protein